MVRAHSSCGTGRSPAERAWSARRPAIVRVSPAPAASSRSARRSSPATRSAKLVASTTVTCAARAGSSSYMLSPLQHPRCVRALAGQLICFLSLAHSKVWQNCLWPQQPQAGLVSAGNLQRMAQLVCDPATTCVRVRPQPSWGLWDAGGRTACHGVDGGDLAEAAASTVRRKESGRHRHGLTDACAPSAQTSTLHVPGKRSQSTGKETRSAKL